MPRYVYPLGRAARADRVGTKAANLAWLKARNFPVPDTLACTFRAHLAYLTAGQRIPEELADQVARWMDPQAAYAVRSSADLEDRPGDSFAGQFLTLLDVRGREAVLHAVEQVYASCRSPRVEAYLEERKLVPGQLRMGVIIQEMVEPGISGVAFSRNPMTGAAEVVVEAVTGSGERLVQDGATPLRWVWKRGGFDAAASEALVDPAVIASVVEQVRRAEGLWRGPVDVEWVYDGRRVYLVQLRPMGPRAAVEVFSNRMSREFLPGLIKPLVWSINIPLVNGAWIDLFSELVGPTGLKPEDLARSVRFRAYFNMSAVARVFQSIGFSGDSLEMLMGGGKPGKKALTPSLAALRHLPRVVSFLLRKLHYPREVAGFVKDREGEYRQLALRPLDEMSDEAVLAQVDELLGLNRRTAYHNIVVPLFMGLFNRLLKSRLSRRRIDYEQIDTTSNLPELEPYDPKSRLEALRERFASLPRETREALSALATGRSHALRGSSLEELEAVPGAAEFRRELESFLERFGHLRDSGNDFSSVPWREKPQAILRMVLEQPRREKGAARIHWRELAAAGSSLRRSVRRAQRYLVLREAVSYTYTYGYGLFRDCFRALGERWVSRDFLDSWEDILFLTLDELREIVRNRAQARQEGEGQPLQGVRDTVARRRSEMELCADLNPPEIVYGQEDPPLVAAAQLRERLSGTPTSRGYYTGRARVIRSVDDFDRLLPGEVLVIPYSDVAWTALFPKAGAVVSESGGMLSHSSIVAREYRIPCVVAVTNATTLLDGRTVSVDGYHGTVTVQEANR